MRHLPQNAGLATLGSALCLPLNCNRHIVSWQDATGEHLWSERGKRCTAGCDNLNTADT